MCRAICNGDQLANSVCQAVCFALGTFTRFRGSSPPPRLCGLRWWVSSCTLNVLLLSMNSLPYIIPYLDYGKSLPVIMCKPQSGIQKRQKLRLRLALARCAYIVTMNYSRHCWLHFNFWQIKINYLVLGHIYKLNYLVFIKVGCISPPLRIDKCNSHGCTLYQTKTCGVI